jgi:hypothetical protein
MQEFIARENIKRFQAQLDACSNPDQCAMLSRLLEAEQRELQEILAGRQNGSEPNKESS